MHNRGRWPMLIIEHCNGEITEISVQHGWERNSWELIVNSDDDASRTVFPLMGNVKSYTVIKRSRQAMLDERVRDLAPSVRDRTCKHGSRLAACATCVLDDKDFRDYPVPGRENIEQTILRDTEHAIDYNKLCESLNAAMGELFDKLSHNLPAARKDSFSCIHGSPPCASCEDMTCTHGGHPATCVFCAESAANPTIRPPR
jgi:hypothetical protein